MIEIQVSDADVNFGRILDGGWYQVELKPVVMKDKKSKPGQNYVVTVEVLGPNDSNGPTTGVQVTRYYPTDADQQKWLMPLLRAVNGGSLAAGAKVNMEAIAGTRVDAYIIPKQQEGSDRTNNELADFDVLGKRTSK